MDASLATVAARAYGGDGAVVAAVRPGGGSSFHQAAILELADGRRAFVKWNPEAPADLFASEAAGLAALTGPASAGELRVPGGALAGGGEDGVARFLAMAAIESGTAGKDFAARFGRGLARMHRAGTGRRTGFPCDNYLGATPQPNGWSEDPVAFFRDRRLGHQLALARERGLSDPELDRLGDRLLDRLERWLPRDEPPCLLHGDLWSGNYLVDREGTAVLIDPAPWWGPREADLAMTRLFGGFPPAFYAAYEEEWPLPPGGSGRQDLHRLYHLLNHLNLFGRGYRDPCLATLRRLAG